MDLQARRNAMEASITWTVEVARWLGLTNLSLQNASKNAGEMINKWVPPSTSTGTQNLMPCRFQILYNRQRQAAITGELVEIITGATASADM